MEQEIIEKTEQKTNQGRGFWEDLKQSKEFSLYYPNRFEYFVGRALQGLVTGRAEKDLRTVVRRSIELAVEMEEALDITKNN
jgi:hypothetical protein